MSRLSLFAALLVLLFVAPLPPAAAQNNQSAGNQSVQASQSAAQKGGVTGLPLPRFVSLRAVEVNLRTGPGIRYPIDWVYRREGLPVEVIDEFESWRRIRDSEGTTGWVHQSMLSAKRTAIVVGERRSLLAAAQEGAAVVAYLDPGVLAQIQRCDGRWCEASVQDAAGNRYRGWLAQDAVWGAYPGEAFK